MFAEQPPVVFSGEVVADVESGYLTSSGMIYDTRPVATQYIYARLDSLSFGYLDGYVWTISSLHDEQHVSHRALFNEFETVLRYGYNLRFPREFTLDTKIGGYWNPPVGYRSARMDYWGVNVEQSLKNPYVVPFWSGLWLFGPKMRGRIRAGLRKPFQLHEDFTVTPSVEAVWVDRRRFQAKYGENPEDDDMFGGAFTAITTSIRAEWRFMPDWTVFLSLHQFDMVNAQARDAVDSSHGYWQKSDWLIVRAGVSYEF